jgi:outer membrane lipoprotein SlyB|tara:strand:- start:79 stop:546 length:468 start_codon:yes stop_codon:yes gene_type:complete
MIKFLLIIPIIFIYSCSSTSPTDVKTSDAQKVTAVEYGIIKSASPIKIKGESNWIGATAGGMIGGLLGTQVCGKEEIVGTKCQDIAVVYGTIGGAAIGTVAQGILGNHDGFQYIVDIDNDEKDSAFVQGDKTPISKGQRVVIIYGNDIRVLPYEE